MLGMYGRRSRYLPDAFILIEYSNPWRNTEHA